MHTRKKHKNIILGSTRFKVIELTEPLRMDTEVYPGDPVPNKRVHLSFDTAPCQLNVYSVGDHNFHPHGDGPNHQNKIYKNRGFEYWDMDYKFNQACMVDLSKSNDATSIDGIKFIRCITAGHLQEHLIDIKKAKALVIRTGYDKWLEANKKHQPENIPFLDKSAIELIAKCNLKVIATDSITIDAPNTNYGHRKFKDMLIVECLVNLYSIPAKNRTNFSLQTSTIAICGATGGPIAAYAYIQMPDRK